MGSSPSPQCWGGCCKSSSSSPFNAPWCTKLCPLYGTCPCRFDRVLTHQPPALCRKCHSGDTHPCRSVSSQGNKSSKQRNARALGSPAQSCSPLSHSQAAAIPDILRLPTSMQRRFAIKSPWDHCQAFSFFFFPPPNRALASACHGKVLAVVLVVFLFPSDFLFKGITSHHCNISVWSQNYINPHTMAHAWAGSFNPPPEEGSSARAKNTVPEKALQWKHTGPTPELNPARDVVVRIEVLHTRKLFRLCADIQVSQGGPHSCLEVIAAQRDSSAALQLGRHRLCEELQAGSLTSSVS